jgi:hypothetical protein
MNKKITLGQKVSFNSVYRRCSKHIASKYGSYGGSDSFKYWKQFPHAKETGIVVGIRSLSSGEVHYDSDYGLYYSTKESIPAVLVATSLRREIVKVPLECVEVEI